MEGHRGAALVSGAMMLEDFFDGTLLSKMLKSCPIGAIAGLFRNGGHMIEAVFCFRWVRLIVSMLPTRGKVGYFLRGGLLLVIFAEWTTYSWLQSNLMKEQAENINYLYYLYLLCIVFGIITVLADPKVSITPQRQRYIDERAKEYKKKLSVDLKYCGTCEQVQVFRSSHSQLEGRCVAKLEYYSFVLNTAVGARNLLPMTFFNLCIFLVHYAWLSITTDILAGDLTEKIEPWQFFVGGLYVMYGILFSLKELVSNLISWITGTTNIERKSNLSPPYFKGSGGSYNPFFKSVWIHVQEVFIAFFSSPTSTKYTMCEPSLPANLEEEDEEKQKSQPISEVDIIMAKYLNPFATRLACDWTQMDLLTLFEVECEMRDVMRGAMKKMLAKMRGISRGADSDEGSDEDVFVMDIKPPASAFPPSNSSHSHGHGGCGSCKSHSHQKPSGSAKSTPQQVKISEPQNQAEEPTEVSETQDL